MKIIKKAAIIQDISCYGKCSMTIGIPVLAAAGIEVSPIPTAILSAHTGWDGRGIHMDLGGEMRGITRHWKEIGISFDGIYTGYMSSTEQIESAAEFVENFGKEAVVVVDPAMGDGGRMYRGLSEGIREKMKELCERADIILPNLTEGKLLLNKEQEVEECAARIAEELRGRYGASVILTGVPEEGSETGCIVSERGGGTAVIGTERISGSYHGTGDLFASCVTAAVLNGRNIQEAAEIGVRYTASSVMRTKEAGRDVRHGLIFESSLIEIMKLFLAE